MSVYLERYCPHCKRQLSDFHYKKNSNGELHLGALCQEHGIVYIPRIDGLDLEVFDRKMKSVRRKDGIRVIKRKTKVIENTNSHKIGLFD